MRRRPRYKRVAQEVGIGFVSLGGKELERVSKAQFNRLYKKYNRREYVHPDPLEFLYDFSDRRDREVVGLIASSLAYGRVTQILKSVSEVLDRMGPPTVFLNDATPNLLRRTFRGFKHRFTTGGDVARLLLGARGATRRFGSLQECFMAGYRTDDETVLPALCAFTEELASGQRRRRNSLLPSPAVGSACKRLNLFLRWMVRRDRVDPGGWDEVPAAKLIVPLDIHMHRICMKLGFTKRKQANMRTAMEVTTAFRLIAPEDPARYDFALTRLGIRDDLDPKGWLSAQSECDQAEA
jgi:uncharacterized protein (TIGR02757 family)